MHPYMIATVALSAVSLLLVILSIRLWTENYARLPDKFPIHFGLNGKADLWTKKTPARIAFFAAIMPVVLLITMAAFLAPALLMPDSVPPEFPVFGAALCLSMSLLFFNINRGAIDFTLGQTQSINRYFIPPLILVLLCSASLSYFSMSMSGKKTVFVSAVTAKSVTRRNTPDTPSTSFSPTDKYVYAVVKMRYLNSPATFNYEWITPSGIVAHRGSYAFNPGRKYTYTRYTWYRLDLEHFRHKIPDINGPWHVKISLGNKPLTTLNFTINTR